MKLSDIKVGTAVKLVKDLDMIGAARRVDKPFKVFAIHDDGRIELTSDGRHVVMESWMLAVIEPVPTPVQELAQVFARLIGECCGGEFVLNGNEVEVTKSTAQENRILLRLDNGLLVTMTIQAVMGDGYANLGPNDRVQAGDEYYDLDQGWIPSICIGARVGDCKYRRRV